jgi:hypothetical protein
MEDSYIPLEEVIFPIKSLSFIYVFFLILEKSQYVGKDVKPYYKALKFIVQYVGNKRVFHNVNEYNR